MNAKNRLIQRLLWSTGEARRRRLGAPMPAGPALGRRRPEAQPHWSPRSDGIADAVGPPSSQGGSPRLELTVAVRSGQAVLGVLGQLDGETGAAFLERVQALAEQGARSMVVDLGGALVDEGGLDALVGASGIIDRHRGELVLKSPRSETLKLLERAGLGAGFVIC